MATDTQVISIPLDELTLEQLVQLSQGLGRDIDKLREQRAYLKGKIDERLQEDAAVAAILANPSLAGLLLPTMSDVRAARVKASVQAASSVQGSGAVAPGARIEAGVQG
jgi:hypothetical protein